MDGAFVVREYAPVSFEIYLIGLGSFVLLALASWCVGEGGEILGAKYDASIIGGLVIAWLNTGTAMILDHRGATSHRK